MDEHLIESIASELKLVDIHRLCNERNRRGKRSALDQLLARQQRRCTELTDTLARTYFSHAMTVRSSSAGGGMA